MLVRVPCHRALACLLTLQVACVTLFPASASAQALRYRVEGVSDELRDNVRAYLGKSPDDADEAEAFLVSAPSRAEQALQALGYYNGTSAVDVDRSVNPWRVVVRVTPGEALHYTQIEVELLGESATDTVLRAYIDRSAPQEEDAVHHGIYSDFKNGLQQLARQRGYFDAQYLRSAIDIDVGAGTATLHLTLDSGQRYRLGEVRADPSVLDPQLLQRLLPFAPGDYYEQRLILELRQRLLRLGYFSSVVILPDVPARDAGQVPLSVDLVAAPSHSFEVGAGFSTDTRQRLSVSWRSPRLNARGHSQETVARWSPVNPQARITYSIPLDDPANDVLQIRARLENNEFGDLESFQQELALRREFTALNRVSSIQVRGLRENWGVFRDEFDADFLLAGVSHSRRRRAGEAVDPTRGLSQFYSAEAGAAALGSNEDVLRLYGSWTGVKRLNDHWRVASRAELGLLWTASARPDELPPSLAFFAGGDNSIRGYAYQSVGREIAAEAFKETGDRRALTVGGTRLLTGSLELQRYFSDSWRGALFVDAGDAFVDSNFDLNVGVGVGVHYLSPVGALRLEIANPVTQSGGDWRVHINIGAEF